LKDLTWTTCLRMGVTAAAVYLICAGRETLSALVGALSPLLLGGGVACIVNIPMSALERRFFPGGGRLGRVVCLTASLAGVIATAAWLAGVLVPELLRGATMLAGAIPELLTRLMTHPAASGALSWLTAAGLPDGQTLLMHGVTLALESADEALLSAAGALSALTAGAANALMALILAAYILAGKERHTAQLTRLSRRLLSGAAQARLARIASAGLESLRIYLRGQCLEALLLGCLCLLGMALLRLPQALTISAMAGVTALLPLIGTPLAAAAGAALLLPQSAQDALTFAVFFLTLQQVESNLIYPRIVGATLGLSPVWTLAAMLLGGGLFGLGGAVLAVPAAAAARSLLTKEDLP